MAVFLLKSKLGPAYLPPPATGARVRRRFRRAPSPRHWIEDLADSGISAGCGAGLFCPDGTVTRAQMAVFLLKARNGAAWTPPAATGIFDDVPSRNPFAAWIEALAAEGVTAGCGGGNYCPDNPNTRGQMAVFLTKTFGMKVYGP